VGTSEEVSWVKPNENQMTKKRQNRVLFVRNLPSGSHYKGNGSLHPTLQFTAKWPLYSTFKKSAHFHGMIRLHQFSMFFSFRLGSKSPLLFLKSSFKTFQWANDVSASIPGI
jgi:hypothetical protein